MKADEAKKIADHRNSDEFQFEGILGMIEHHATGKAFDRNAQMGQPHPGGAYSVKFQPLKPEFITRLVEMGYTVRPGTHIQKTQNEKKEVIETSVDVTEVIWGEQAKMEVVKDGQ